MMNTGVKKYQAVRKAATAVAEGRLGAKAKLAAAQKAYVSHVETTGKKELAAKIADAKKKSVAAAKVSGIGRAKAKKTTAKKTTAKRKTTTTARKKTATTRKR